LLKNTSGDIGYIVEMMDPSNRAGDGVGGGVGEMEGTVGVGESENNEEGMEGTLQ
jgi:hypothetical protein